MTPRPRASIRLLAIAACLGGVLGSPGAPSAQAIIVCTPRYDCYPGDPAWRPYTPEDRAQAQRLETQREEQRRQAAIAEQRHRDTERAIAQVTRQENLRAAAARLRDERRAAEADARDRANRCGRYRDPNARSSCVTPQ